jgi:alpha-tubulin suppressor-like RCC1 family protein
MRPIRSVPLLLLALLAACDSPSSSAPGAPARMDIVAGDMQSGAVVGQELPNALVVRVLDDDGDPVAGQLVNFVVTAGAGTVFAGAALTNAQGEARERWTMGHAAGDTQRVEVRAVDAATGEARVFATFRAVAGPGAPDNLERLPLPGATGAAGQTLPDSLGVRVRDQFFNPVPGATVTWAATSGGGSVSSATAVSRADGTAKVAWTLGGAAGPQTARASVGGQAPVDFTANAIPGGAVTVEIVTPPLSFTSLLQEIPVQVTGRDAFGNAVAGAAVTLVSLNDRVVGLIAGPARAVAYSSGSTRIVASLQNGAADSVDVVVQQVPAFLYVWPDTSHLLPGESVTFWTQAYDANRRPITNPSMTYASNNLAVATVQGGSAVAHAPGRAGITGTASSGIQDRVIVEVYGPFSAQSVDAGDRTTCAISGGITYCWGSNHYGELGTGGNTLPSRTPVPVAGGVPFARVWASDHGGGGTCALTGAGQAYCWGGLWWDYQPGSRTPAAVPGGHTFTTLAVGASTRCGVTPEGAVYCWGSNKYGTLGNGDTVSTRTPVRVASGVTFRDVAVGWRHACAVATSGTVYCWGSNADGEGGGIPNRGCLGNPDYACHLTPRAVEGRNDFVQVVVGFQSSCALTAGGAAYCWGSNYFGELGIDLGIPERYTATAVSGGYTFASLSGGSRHRCALTAAGEAYCWGTSLQSGLPGGRQLPGRAAPGLTFTSISGGGAHTCGVATGGGVYCWGSQEEGERGDGYLRSPGRIEPVRVRTR